jgi:hypothetical protein
MHIAMRVLSIPPFLGGDHDIHFIVLSVYLVLALVRACVSKLSTYPGTAVATQLDHLFVCNLIILL